MDRRSLLAAGVLGLLSGCGFQPLYGDGPAGHGLSAVQVVAPAGRAGFLIREHLDDALGRAPKTPAVYRMDLQVAQVRYPRGLRVDNVATRYELVMTANYQLNEIAGGAAVKNGSVQVQVTYDSADQPYASVAAQQDAEDRAAAEAARRIELELATWLAKPKP